MNQRRHTFCRICEPMCPMQAEIDEAGRVVQLLPDPGHPSGGTPCHKGLSFLEVHRDPDRLDRPLRRENPRNEARGQFAETDWDSALNDVGVRIRRLIDRYGPDAVAFYFGNPGVFNTGMLVMSSVLPKSIGTRMLFGAATLDSSNKLAAADAIYGSESSVMVPDFLSTEYLLVLGANPRVSRWTLASVPNGVDVLKQIKQRGGKVQFVNPRRTESSTDGTGPTLLIRPGTDVYFLAAVLNHIERRYGFDEQLLARHGKNVDGLRGFIGRYPPAHVAKVTGIDESEIMTVADELAAAKSAAVYISTGVNQSRQGVLCSWLVEMINFLTGNLGRTGGTYSPGAQMAESIPAKGTQRVETSIGTFELADPIGHVRLPMTVLPDLINSGDVRALIVLSGNPLLSAGGEAKLRQAFEKLDLMVSIDIYRSATAEMSDYVLPATDWLERSDINRFAWAWQVVPYVQYTEAMEAPAGGRREDWWILSRLLQTAGLPSPLDALPDACDASSAVQGILEARGLTIDAMRESPHNSIAFAQQPRESVFKSCLHHPDQKVDCFPAAFTKTGLFDRCEAIFEELSTESSDTLRLIGLRTTHMHNTWQSNVEMFRRGRQQINPLNICEADAAARGLHDGDAVRISTSHGNIQTRVLINNELRPGAVAMSHGYGHESAYSLQIASARPGANTNALAPTGPGTAEPLSNMSWLSGLPVHIERIEPGSAE